MTTSAALAKEDRLSFLTALWEGKPQKAAIQLWEKHTKRSYYYAAIAPAAEHVSRSDLYCAAGLAAKDKASKYRRTAPREVIATPGVWADIDVNGGPEDKRGAAPTVQDALDLATLIEPTILVNSGYGIQAWWLWDEGPWCFTSRPEQEQAARLCAAFQAMLRAAAKRRGFGLDFTHDLGRLMRLPGTVNCKGAESGIAPVPVRLISVEGPRYSVETIGRLAHPYMDRVSIGSLQLPAREGSSVAVRADATPPQAKLSALAQRVPELNALWQKTATRTRHWSHSQYEMALTNHLVAAGWSDQEICDTLVCYRNIYEPGDPRGKNRPDRLMLTIAKARAGSRSAPTAASPDARAQNPAARTSAPPGRARAARAACRWEALVARTQGAPHPQPLPSNRSTTRQPEMTDQEMSKQDYQVLRAARLTEAMRRDGGSYLQREDLLRSATDKALELWLMLLEVRRSVLSEGHSDSRHDAERIEALMNATTQLGDGLLGEQPEVLGTFKDLLADRYHQSRRHPPVRQLHPSRQRQLLEQIAEIQILLTIERERRTRRSIDEPAIIASLNAQAGALALEMLENTVPQPTRDLPAAAATAPSAA